MRRLIWSSLLFLGGLSGSGQAGEITIEGRTFRVPDGFVLEKVAGPPLVDRPIVADFDESGRLYVADSSGSNENVKKQVVDRPHRIVRLEDQDGDGKFDHSVVFADQMMFPEGAMWLNDSLYVAAPPSIWKLTDTDGDGVVDRREEWFQGKTLTGCANDLHGPYAGPDGWIYWCKGAFATQTYDRPGRQPLVTRAAHIFRARPDGSKIEPVMSGGMDNPVEVAFTSEGERIFTTTFLQHPGGGHRDGLIHALYGGLYGKDHDVIDGHPRTGPDLLPPLVHLGPAAPSGLMRAESDALGCKDQLFTACFNLRKVTRHKLTSDGATFQAQTEDLVASDDLDFHPTDVLEDADGSLLIIDTGGWYKICCPTSQLVKPDVLGGIYRLKRLGGQPIADPRGLKLGWAGLTPEDLAVLLSDPRPAVRKRALSNLARQGEMALPAIARAINSGSSPEARSLAIWAACRSECLDVRDLIRDGLNDRVASVRQVATHAVGVWRDPKATSRLIEILKNDPPAGRRAAAEALGRIGNASAVPVLLEAGASTDLALRHSAIYALIEIDHPQAMRVGLSSPSPLIRRAALIALDQREGSRLDSSPVISSLSSPVPDLNEAAWWIAGHHPEWGEALAGSIRATLSDGSPARSFDLAALERRLASTSQFPAIQTLLGESFNGRNDRDLMLLRAMAISGLKDVPRIWLTRLEQSLGHRELPVLTQAIATTRALPIHPDTSLELTESLFQVARRPDLPTSVRQAALAAIPGGLKRIEAGIFEMLLNELAADRPANARTTAADVLARATLEPEQFAKLAEALAHAGPLEISRLVEAFSKADGDEIGQKLVDSLMRSPGRSSLRVETIKPRLDRFGPSVKSSADTLYRAIATDSSDHRGRLEALLGNLKSGDIRRGQAVFNGSKASCVTCHAIGYVGGKLGPDLTRIGQVRAERDLLESIVFPSASFVRSFEPVSIATRDGKVVSGLLRKDSAEELVVAVAADRDERIARDLVEEIKPGTVSIMPAGLEQQLSSQELSDLIAFLKACR